MSQCGPGRSKRGLSRDLETICLHCLEKTPGRRYPSVLALVDDLDRYLEGRPIVVRPVGPIHAPGRWCKRRPGLAASLAALLLATLIGVSGITWQRRAAVIAERTAHATSRMQSARSRDPSMSPGGPRSHKPELASMRQEVLLDSRDRFLELLNRYARNPRL